MGLLRYGGDCVPVDNGREGGVAKEIGKNELGLAFGTILEKSLGYEIICKGRGFVGRGRFFGVELECLRQEFV